MSETSDLYLHFVSRLKQTDSVAVDSEVQVPGHLLPGFVALHLLDSAEYDRLEPGLSATCPKFAAYLTVVAAAAVCSVVVCTAISRRTD